MNLLKTVVSMMTLLAFIQPSGAQVSQTQKMTKQEVKDYFKTVDPTLRQQLIKDMQVIHDASSIDQEHQKSVLEHMTNICGLPYVRDQKTGVLILPIAKCTYQARNPKNPFQGMSPKFDCLFESVDPKTQEIKNEKVKVKYDAAQRSGGGYKEIPQAVLGTQFARLFGFYSNTYCPVKQLTCIGCPSQDPWSNSRSQALTVKDKTVIFKDVVFEIEAKGMVITDKTAATMSKPQGFSFNDEMSKYLPLNGSLRQGTILDREQIDIWVNFIRHNDADPHNNKLICKEFVFDKNQKPSCTNVYGTVNDYGNSFGYAGSNSKMSLSEFMKSSLRRPFSLSNLFSPSSNSDIVTTGAASSASDYKVSKESIKNFIERGLRIQEEDLLDIFDLAQINTVSGKNSKEWSAGFRKKLKDMNQF